MFSKRRIEGREGEKIKVRNSDRHLTENETRRAS
jgi:hypothetical protein